MFQKEEVQHKGGRSTKYILKQEDRQLRYGEFLSLLEEDSHFRAFFIELLSEVPFKAYHWETPPVTNSTRDQPFEFVVINSPGIDLPPNPGPFRQYFADQNSNDIAVFNNLGNDAKLIAPEPVKQGLNYSHIGVFTREAPEEQQHGLWQTVGRVTQEQIRDQPIWLNTAGGGVAWLHVRLDSRPKYYKHLEYRKAQS